MADPFGRALLDYHRGEKEAPLFQVDGDERLTHPVGSFYFESFDSLAGADWIASWLDGPLLDVGAGAGRDALSFQQRYETVALEISDPLVALLAERGVERVRHGDMFALRDLFDRDRFRSALIVGTQASLAASMHCLRAFLGDLAHVTAPDATAVLDTYDPGYGDAEEMLGFRPDPTPGLAFRVLHYEYEGDVGETLLFRLFGPDRLREATAGTGWTVAEIRRPHDTYHYRAALRKR
ncbi:SAM-dependent methyltransferase [Halobacteriales archaeon SW_7_65_23]|nr:MAG: SAM-dependent methyltransferase [Halobacteriales archaeon SW_7_65_23]